MMLLQDHLALLSLILFPRLIWYFFYFIFSRKPGNSVVDTSPFDLLHRPGRAGRVLAVEAERKEEEEMKDDGLTSHLI